MHVDRYAGETLGPASWRDIEADGSGIGDNERVSLFWDKIRN